MSTKQLQFQTLLKCLKEQKSLDQSYNKIYSLLQVYENHSLIYLNNFLQSLQYVTNPIITLRYLNIVHGTFQQSRYNSSVLETFEQQGVLAEQKPEGIMQKWLAEEPLTFYHKYLTRISLNKELYGQMVNKNIKEKPITNLFILINQFNLFNSHAKNMFNVAGRYYYTLLPEMQYLYQLMFCEYGEMYEFLRELVDYICTNYQNFTQGELQCFLEAAGEIDRINDILQQIFKNKYYSKYSKIEFIELTREQQYNICVRLHKLSTNTDKILPL